MFISNGLWIPTAISSVNAFIPNKAPPKITNRKLKSILNQVCNGGEHFSYDSKKVLYDRLKGQDLATHVLAKEITVNSNGLDLDFVLNIIFEHFKCCPECRRGIMEKEFPPHTYDYNKDGWIPPYCSTCGCGYPEYIVTYESNGKSSS